EITAGRRHNLRQGPRVPERPPGKAPGLALEVSSKLDQDRHSFTARARVTEGSAPVYYTSGADRNGIYHNVLVLWELFGPNAEDYRQLSGRVISPATSQTPALVETQFRLEQPGRYRLRAATADN